MANESTLEHLKNCIPEKANNYMLSTCSIILEAWRRGLQINIRIVLEKTGKIEPYYSISDGKSTHKFSATRGDLVSEEAKILTKNKKSTKEYLLKNNVPTPIGTEFGKTATDEEIIQYADQIKFPVVIKPIEGTGGTGVIANIQNKDELIEALNYVRKDLKSPHIIIERYFEGQDYRLYVIDNEVVAALKRVRSHVIGDGINTIKDLVNKKNEERKKLPSLTNRPIIIDHETMTLLKRNNYNLKSIPKKGEIVYLKTKNNVSSGGDSIDITDDVSENIKRIAIAAANSFPSLPHCGLDMIVNEEEDNGVIIELNSRAHITQHLFPMKGKARDIPTKIIDYYFPNTKQNKSEEANKLYIDYDFIFNFCLSRSAAEIKLPKIPSSPILLKRYIVSDIEYSNKLAHNIKRAAFNNWMNGYIKPLTNGKIVIVIGGNEKRVKKFELDLQKRLKKYTKNFTISEKSRNTPIQHGFYIEDTDTNNTSSASKKTHKINDADVYLNKYSDLKRDYQKLVRRVAELEQQEQIIKVTNKQNRQLKKELKKMTSSTSWKVTKPLRSLGKLKK